MQSFSALINASIDALSQTRSCGFFIFLVIELPLLKARNVKKQNVNKNINFKIYIMHYIFSSILSSPINTWIVR